MAQEVARICLPACQVDDGLARRLLYHDPKQLLLLLLLLLLLWVQADKDAIGSTSQHRQPFARYGVGRGPGHAPFRDRRASTAPREFFSSFFLSFSQAVVMRRQGWMRLARAVEAVAVSLPQSLPPKPA